MKNKPKPIVLAILDGWGYSDLQNNNAIAQANTPHWDKWWNTCPQTLLNSSGFNVGLPDNQMGNSEVGHMHLGAGRLIYQDLTRIDQAIQNGQFYQNSVLLKAFHEAQQANRAVHILGLLSPGGVHSHEQHIQAIVELAAQQGVSQLYVHAFLDGRDTPPRSAETSLRALQDKLNTLRIGKIASICGRYYAMDRDQRWERTKQTYDMLISGKATYKADDAISALHMAYTRNESDEFVQPTLLNSFKPMANNDIIIFMNFRADRARQLTRAIIQDNFSHFLRNKKINPSHFITLTQYADDIPSEIAFPPDNLVNTLGEIFEEKGLKQLRIAETEKYAHVTFFFNGGREKPFSHETRILISSPKVATYDLQPEMSAPELTNTLIKAIETQHYDVIICNYANADMVGHSGNLKATIQAIECIDVCLGKLVVALQKVGGELLITADHGNAEWMFDEKTKQAHTAHTTSPVPFIYIGRSAKIAKENGSLIDVAPTILYLLDLPKPTVMTGSSLLTTQ